MTIAVLSWMMSILVLGASFTLFARNGRVAGMAVVIILALQTGVRPLLFFSGLDRPFPAHFFREAPWDLVATGSLLCAAWMLILVATYLAVSPVSAPVARLLPGAPAGASPGPVMALAAGLTTLSILATGYLIAREGSVASFLFAVKIGKEMKGLYLFREISTLAVILSAFGLFLLAVPRPGQPARHLSKGAWLMIALIAINFTVNYLWGNRYNIAIMMLSLACGWHFYVRRLSVLKIIVGASLALMLLQGLKVLRGELVEQVVGRQIQSGYDFWTDLSASLHFVEFDALLLAVRDVGDRFDWRGGADLFNGLTSWVPRFLYPEKETYHIGGWFRRLYQPETINGWPITSIGAWYINFGLAGVVLGGVVSGIVTAVFDAAYRNPARSAWVAAVGPAVSFAMLEGGVNFGFPQRIVLLLIPLFLMSLLLSRRSSGARASPGRLPL